MLEFMKNSFGYRVNRENGDCVCLFIDYQNAKIEPNFQKPDATPDELRQIAAKVAKQSIAEKTTGR